jgi:hypothetical protein
MRIVNLDDDSSLIEFADEPARTSAPDARDVMRDPIADAPVIAPPIRHSPARTNRRNRALGPALALCAAIAVAFASGAYLYEWMSEPSAAAAAKPRREEPAQQIAATANQSPDASLTPPAREATKAPVAPVTEARPAPAAVTANASSTDAPRPDRVESELPLRDVSGTWTLDTRVESSLLKRYEGLQLGYRVTLEQDGTRITGRGVKVRENDNRLRAQAQTPIELIGRLEGDRLRLAFREDGRLRQSAGTILISYQGDDMWNGRFASDAARSAGVVIVHRE